MRLGVRGAPWSADSPPRATAVVLCVLIPFGCGYYLSYLFRTINAVISPRLVAEFGLTPADLGFLTSVYFITFAAVQIPLGVILDRYGPRRVQTALLVVAALGAGVFAIGEGFAWLSVGRGLIGLGVASCLMSSFKANAIWWPAERLPLINNVTMAFGSFGALSATAPVEALLQVTGWREMFAGLAVVTALIAVATYVIVPERAGSMDTRSTMREQFAALPEIFTSAVFWRFAGPSYQTLWAAPWLRDVAGLGTRAVAEHLLAIQLGMFAGVLLTGVIADRLRLRGIGPERVFAVALAVAMAIQVALALGVTIFVAALWTGYALFASATILVFAILTERFPPALTGRVITAANLLIFVLAFGFQWGIGAIIGLFPVAADGGYDADAHTTAFLVILAVQVLAVLSFARRGARK
jgi:MFS family permease